MRSSESNFIGADACRRRTIRTLASPMTLLRKLPFYIQVLCLALIFSAASAAERKKWETLSDCQYVAKEHNDGDSFHVKCSSREFVLRLYYVDAPEVSVRGNAERVREQSDHFGVMSEDIPEAGLKARDAVRKILKKPFVVQTRWAVAGGRSAESRYYGMVEMEGRRLVEILVGEGLARTKGRSINLPTGEKSSQYVQKLRALESDAKKHRKGIWAHSTQ